MNNEWFGNGFGLEIDGCLTRSLEKYMGQTVTIFTKSGGMSGCGFTGVVLCVDECVVKLLTRIGPAPGCSLGNSCTGNPYSNGMGCSGKIANNMPIGSVGSVVEIPTCSIASFVHNAV